MIVWLIGSAVALVLAVAMLVVARLERVKSTAVLLTEASTTGTLHALQAAESAAQGSWSRLVELNGQERGGH